MLLLKYSKVYVILFLLFRIARLDMSALNDGVVLAQSANQNQNMPDQDSSVDTTAGQGTQNGEEDDPPIVIRSRRRRQRPINPAPPLGSLEEDVIEEEREEIGNEEMVLLFPRLVLDRYTDMLNLIETIIVL